METHPQHPSAGRIHLGWRKDPDVPGPPGEARLPPPAPEAEYQEDCCNGTQGQGYKGHDVPEPFSYSSEEPFGVLEEAGEGA